MGQDNTKRGDINPGSKVLVVQKHHQKTGELTEGIVKDILTNSKNHHRGIKVRLQSGIVGRVQKVIM
ncbi:MAG: YwbE family protein [Oscillospiraceae bacterium]|nr:YwbE family protein [Oscillospiraceae bacterium]